MLQSKNIIPNISVILVLFIIFVSTIPGYIKVVLALFSITFVIPVAREVMFENKLRKIKVAVYTSLIFSLGFTLVPLFAGVPSFEITSLAAFPLVFFFSSIGIFCYGIPASIIAELVSNRYLAHRALISGIIHISFGLFTVIFSLSDYIYPGVFILPAICSVIFFLMDEITRKR